MQEEAARSYSSMILPEYSMQHADAEITDLDELLVELAAYRK